MSAVQKSETSWTLKNYFPTTLPTPPPFSTWLTVINQALQLPVKIRGSGRRHLFAQGCHPTTFSAFHLLQWGTISFLWLAIVNPKRQIQETPISNLVPDGTAVSWSHLGPHSWHLWNDASGSPQPNPHWKSFTKDHNHCPCILLKIPCPAPSMEPSYWPSPVKGPVFGNRRKMRGPNPCQKRRRWLTCKTFCFEQESLISRWCSFLWVLGYGQDAKVWKQLLTPMLPSPHGQKMPLKDSFDVQYEYSIFLKHVNWVLQCLLVENFLDSQL